MERIWLESSVTSHILFLFPGHLPKTVQSLLKPHSPLILGITYLQINPDGFKAKFSYTENPQCIQILMEVRALLL